MYNMLFVYFRLFILKETTAKLTFPKSCSCFLHNEKDKNCLLWISVALHVGVFFSILVHLVLIEWLAIMSAEIRIIVNRDLCIYVCVL